MDKLKSAGKSFEISKWEVWEAYRQVKANKGAPGVDKVTMEDFDPDLRGNLYRIWLCRVRDYAEWAARGLNRCIRGRFGEIRGGLFAAV
jgi:hypothetical protein